MITNFRELQLRGFRQKLSRCAIRMIFLFRSNLRSRNVFIMHILQCQELFSFLEIMLIMEKFTFLELIDALKHNASQQTCYNTNSY